jgi:hypothetical protein
LPGASLAINRHIGPRETKIMDAFLAYKRLTAARDRVAQPIATQHHRHLSQRPFVLACYHLAGDPGAPVGLLYGTDVNSPNLVVIGEPRNRTLRFRGLEVFSQDINTYLDDFRSRSVVLDRNGIPKVGRLGTPQLLADDAPQIVVPNAATADWLKLLARSTVWLQTEGEYAVDPILPRFGGHLTHLTGRSGLPGSANILSATELLDMHWTTGQTDLEDANLSTMLSWIDPLWFDPAWLHATTAPTDGVAAAALAELLPSAGPVSDPRWDIEVLAPLIEEFNEHRRAGSVTDSVLDELRGAVIAALMPGWVATWRSLDLVGALPEAPSVHRRWESDRYAWASHLNRVDADAAFFRRYRNAVQSARLLHASEHAAAEVEAAMALDDPLVMARHIVGGIAVEGTVVGCDDSHTVQGPVRRVRRPILRLVPHEPVLLPMGTSVTWAADTRVSGDIISLPTNDGDPLEIMITTGMRTGGVPVTGVHGCFTTMKPPTRYPDTVPDQVPWTHTVPIPVDPEVEVA